MLKSYENMTWEDKVAEFKNHLRRVRHNLILDGEYFLRLENLIYCFGLEEIKLSELVEIAREAKEYEIHEIAEEVLTYPEDERQEVITRIITSLLCGEFNYKLVREVSNKVYEMSH